MPKEFEQVPLKIPDVQKVLEKLGFTVGDDFDSLTDINKEQAATIAKYNTEELAKLTGLDKTTLLGLQAVCSAIADLDFSPQITVNADGSYTYDSGNGSKPTTENTPEGQKHKEDVEDVVDGSKKPETQDTPNLEKNTWSNIKNVVAQMTATQTSGPVFAAGALANAAKNAGVQKLNLANGWDAAVANTGKIVWHDGTGRIAVYNPETGEINYYSLSKEELLAHGVKVTPQKDGTFKLEHGSGYGNTWEEYAEAYRYLMGDKKKYHFAQGGFAKFTGPAWLDGTRAKPEAVLSATDTKNFMQLKDILTDVMGHISNSETSYGNVTYDIDVNVERLASDYDVDKVAKRIEKIITKDASYRNVTQVRKFR